MSKPRAETLTANPQRELVVFLIGMRINSFLAFKEWIPIFIAMPKMIFELRANRKLGCANSRIYFSGKTVLLVQYWDSAEELISYAGANGGKHRKAWADFNRRSANTTKVGIFHETYIIDPAKAESIYRGMPAYGLGLATDSLVPVRQRGVTAKERLAPHAAVH